MKKEQLIKKLVLLVISFFVFSGISQQNFPTLKAILVVGPQEDGTTESIKKMNELVKLFRSRKIEVHTFYDQKADWTLIKEAAKNAHFFVYSGHGTKLGENGTTGGLCLKSTISVKEMQQDLQLAPNALVLFQSVCMGAGSSAGDDTDIGIKEAEKRVSEYAQTFYKSGAGAYYANNYTDGCFRFLSAILDGKSLQDAFLTSLFSTQKVELTKEFMFNKSQIISLATDDSKGISIRTTYTNGVKKVEKIPSVKSYNSAFVGNPNFTITTFSKTN